MLDPHLLRTDPEGVAAALAVRGYRFEANSWRELDARRKELQLRTQDLQNRKNTSAKSIGQAKARGEGATVYKGRLVDIASIKQAEVIVRQAEMIAGG